VTIYTRTAQIGEHVGRILEGCAFEWDRPEPVHEGSRLILEEFDPTCSDRTIADSPVRALGILHPWSPPSPNTTSGKTSPIPVGAVEFKPSREGLMFTAKLARTVPGDEALELVDLKALSDVSISFKSLRSITRSSPRGQVVRRMEIALRELSLAPPGMGVRPEAKVLSMRTADLDGQLDEDGTPMRDHALRRLRVLQL
jgi:phage head maturation protease